MKFIANALVFLVGLEHLAFLALEMFLWNGPIGHQAFGTTPEFSAQTTALAANLGLYNGFVGAFLIWATIGKRAKMTVFGLLFVIIAGVFGALTVKLDILYIQAAPGLLALLAVWASGLLPKRAPR